MGKKKLTYNQEKLSRKYIKLMKKWTVQKNLFHLAQFLAKEKLSYKELKKLCDLNPKVNSHLEVLKSQILVNWMQRIEEEELTRTMDNFAKHCINNYDLDAISKPTERKEGLRPKVGSDAVILDDKFLGNFENVELEGEAKKLYELGEGNIQEKEG